MTTPTPWDQTGGRPRLGSTDERSMMDRSTMDRSMSTNRDSRDVYSRRDSHTSAQRDRVERLTASRQQHSRNDSGATGAGSAGEYNNEGQHHSTGRRHDYDVQAMESDLSPRQGAMKNPIPAPIVTVRSEFPTLNRSRQQQSLTCLVTVEVPDGNWRPDVEDLRHAPPVQSQPPEDIYSPVRAPSVQGSRSLPYEPQENLEEITEDLRTRVDNWHGLEFQR